MSESIYQDFVNQLDRIKQYDKFSLYFEKEFAGVGLKGLKYKFVKNMANDFYNLAQLDIIVTSVKYSDFAELISAGSVSYMGKYGTFNKVKVNINN